MIVCVFCAVFMNQKKTKKTKTKQNKQTFFKKIKGSISNVNHDVHRMRIVSGYAPLAELVVRHKRFFVFFCFLWFLLLLFLIVCFSVVVVFLRFFAFVCFCFHRTMRTICARSPRARHNSRWSLVTTAACRAASSRAFSIRLAFCARVRHNELNDLFRSLRTVAAVNSLFQPPDHKA